MTGREALAAYLGLVLLSGAMPGRADSFVEPCLLASALDEELRACRAAEIDSERCAWLEAMEWLTAKRFAGAEARLASEFSISQKAARELRLASQFWMLPLVDDCPLDSIDPLMAEYLSGETLLSLMSTTGTFLVCRFLGQCSETADKWLVGIEASSRDGMARAVEVFVELTASNEALQDILREIASSLPSALLEADQEPSPAPSGAVATTEKETPGLLPPLSSGLIDALARIDEVSASPAPVDSRFSEISDMISELRPPEEKVIAWIRFGTTLTARGAFEQAAVALLYASAIFESIDDPGLTVRFTYLLSGLQRIVISRIFGLHGYASQILDAYSPSGSSTLEESLLRNVKRFATGSFGSLEVVEYVSLLLDGLAVEFEEMDLEAEVDPIDFQAFDRAMDLFDLEAFFSIQLPEVADTPDLEGQLGLVEDLLAGEVGGAREKWEAIAQTSPRVDNAYWLACIMIEAIRQGRLKEARSSIERAISYLEARVETLQVDQITRNTIDQILAWYYSVAVELFTIAAEPEPSPPEG